MKTLGDRIRELREQNDLSLRELAAKLGVSASFISDIELGRRNPSDERIRQLARLLGTTLDDLKQFDTRPPIRELRRVVRFDPRYSVALRQMMDREITSDELLEFIEDRDRKRERRTGNTGNEDVQAEDRTIP